MYWITFVLYYKRWWSSWHAAKKKVEAEWCGRRGEMRGRWSFFCLSLDNLERETSFGKGVGGGEGRGGAEEWRKDWKGKKLRRKQSKKNVNTDAKGRQNTQNTPPSCPQLSSLFLYADSCLESLNCGWLPGNQNPVKSVSKKLKESTVQDKSGLYNRSDQS